MNNIFFSALIIISDIYLLDSAKRTKKKHIEVPQIIFFKILMLMIFVKNIVGAKKILSGRAKILSMRGKILSERTHILSLR